MIRTNERRPLRAGAELNNKGMSNAMLAAAVTIYGLLMSFILSAGTRNKREGRTNPRILIMAGYVLCGATIGVAAVLPLWAFFDPAAAQSIVNSL